MPPKSSTPRKTVPLQGAHTAPSPAQRTPVKAGNNLKRKTIDVPESFSDVEIIGDESPAQCHEDKRTKTISSLPDPGAKEYDNLLPKTSATPSILDVLDQAYLSSSRGTIPFAFGTIAAKKSVKRVGGNASVPEASASASAYSSSDELPPNVHPDNSVVSSSKQISVPVHVDTLGSPVPDARDTTPKVTRIRRRSERGELLDTEKSKRSCPRNTAAPQIKSVPQVPPSVKVSQHSSPTKKVTFDVAFQNDWVDVRDSPLEDHDVAPVVSNGKGKPRSIAPSVQVSQSKAVAALSASPTPRVYASVGTSVTDLLDMVAKSDPPPTMSQTPRSLASVGTSVTDLLDMVAKSDPPPTVSQTPRSLPSKASSVDDLFVGEAREESSGSRLLYDVRSMTHVGGDSASMLMPSALLRDDALSASPSYGKGRSARDAKTLVDFSGGDVVSDNDDYFSQFEEPSGGLLDDVSAEDSVPAEDVVTAEVAVDDELGSPESPSPANDVDDSKEELGCDDAVDPLSVMLPSAQDDYLRPLYVNLPVIPLYCTINPWGIDGHAVRCARLNFSTFLPKISRETAINVVSGLQFTNHDLYANLARMPLGSVIADNNRLKIAGTLRPAVLTMQGAVLECHLYSPAATGPTGAQEPVHLITIAPDEQEIRRMVSHVGHLLGFRAINGTVGPNGISFLTRRKGRDFATPTKGPQTPPRGTNLYSSVTSPLATGTSQRRSYHPLNLGYDDNVPIYDGRASVRHPAPFRFTDDDFDHLSKFPLFRGGKRDLPNDALVTVGFSVNKYVLGSGTPGLSTNVLFVILHGLVVQ